MTFDEYHAWEMNKEIRGKDLVDQTDRTLLYGYTCDRATFHVYLKEGIIYKAVYFKGRENLPQMLLSEDEIPLSGYVPDKRLYPDGCDIEFCKLLKARGVVLYFTAYTEAEPRQFYGETY